MHAEERERIRHGVAQRPAKHRDAIVLHHLKGLTTAEIGRLQDLPETNVRTRIRRGRELLRGRLGSVWRSVFALPWWLQDSLQPMAGGVAMKNKSALVFATRSTKHFWRRSRAVSNWVLPGQIEACPASCCCSAPSKPDSETCFSTSSSVVGIGRLASDKTSDKTSKVVCDSVPAA
jgi:hypothetical protein